MTDILGNLQKLWAARTDIIGALFAFSGSRPPKFARIAVATAHPFTRRMVANSRQGAP